MRRCLPGDHHRIGGAIVVGREGRGDAIGGDVEGTARDHVERCLTIRIENEIGGAYGVVGGPAGGRS